MPAPVRGGLTVESGLNDGLGLRFFVLALAAGGGHGRPGVAGTFPAAAERRNRNRGRPYVLCVMTEGRGFIGTWVAGLAFGVRLRRMPTDRGLRAEDWDPALSLAVARMLPIALSLLGSGLRPASVAYIGWFGPRGLASLVFGWVTPSP
ncbi:hypothetical protein [Streptomyces sp. NPDC006463]|uniref:hypothetical protein n=1 Tax=Streptomyces sp. NPDC006463 TaxID=3364746 RepID=UPI003679AE2D